MTASVSARSAAWMLVRAMLALGAAGACVLVRPAESSGQFPAELTGRVVEAVTSAPIEDAAVEIGAAATARTDASGSFSLRSADAGRVIVRVSRSGYATLERPATLESGRTTSVVFALVPAPIEIDALEVVARRRAEGGHVFTRAAIESSGARTLGELVRTAPGVVVRGSGGGGERASIRGSAADAVLVLVDGTPVNDPMTGEADLSLVRLDGVGSVRVLPGARTARYGPRAEGGVIVVESVHAHERRAEAWALAGAFGEHALGAEAALEAGPFGLRAGARLARREDAFSYDRPEALGGGSATRNNAAERVLSGFAGLQLDAAGAPARLRIDAIDVGRGLPGPMHALTPEARQDLARASLAGGWVWSRARNALRLDATATWQRARFEDPAPAFGPAYLDSTRVREAGVRLEARRVGGVAIERRLAAGLELRGTELRSSTLAPREIERVDPAAFARAGFEARTLPFTPGIQIALRADEWDGGWIASHDVTLGAHAGAVAVTASHRSGFSPPSASDQFFRGGFAIAPNPNLQPERVPSEIEIGASAALEAARIPIQLGASAFRGDIDGMIAWAPDFRFVWSPRNHDVRRDGGEAWLRAAPWPSLELNAWASRARVTYDWPGEADAAQVVYRPRHSGGGALDWRPGAWRASAEALFTGVRQATPGGANPLPGYWDLDAALAREWRVGTVALTTTLAVDRLLDNRHSFVHGYPEPGRRLRFELRASPEATSPATGL